MRAKTGHLFRLTCFEPKHIRERHTWKKEPKLSLGTGRMKPTLKATPPETTACDDALQLES